jgi:hypothetical protein
MGCEDIREFMGGEKKRKAEVDGEELESKKRVSLRDERRRSRDGDGGVSSSTQVATGIAKAGSMDTPNDETRNSQISAAPTTSLSASPTSIPPKPPNSKIFAGLTVYVNGSTAPLISDHKLKHTLASNGANISIALGRRSVTHVILGTSSSQGGAGGGLAAGKIQKEIMKKRGGRGTGVRFVGVEWYVFSLYFLSLCSFLEGKFELIRVL